MLSLRGAEGVRMQADSAGDSEGLSLNQGVPGINSVEVLVEKYYININYLTNFSVVCLGLSHVFCNKHIFIIHHCNGFLVLCRM